MAQVLERTSSGIAPEPTFAPSELVYLNGDRFSPEVGTFALNATSVELLHTDGRVSARRLAEAMPASALLANEREDALRLVPAEKRGWFGLRTHEVLAVELGEADPGWPAHSVEARVLAIANDLAARQPPVQVQDVIYRLLGADSPNPYLDTIDVVSAGLAARDLLETVETKHLGFFATTSCELPAETAAAVRSEDVEQVRNDLSAVQSARPDVWAHLVDQITRAVNRRTETDDTMDWD